ncbi:hypothetical protein NMY22_g13732 [Coprinellus aureogranulatus]|nr:hypothetical protein NMY22_g13732 [Coprinellus aureogranulatus]
MLSSTFTLQLQQLMDLMDALDIGPKTPLEIVMAMGKVGVEVDNDTSYTLFGLDAPPELEPQSKGKQIQPPSPPTPQAKTIQFGDLPSTSAHLQGGNRCATSSKVTIKPPSTSHRPPSPEPSGGDPPAMNIPPQDTMINRDKYMAITVGRKVGVIYGFNEAAVYVVGYSNNTFKGFKSRAEAVERFWSRYHASQVYCETGEVLGIDGLARVPKMTWVRERSSDPEDTEERDG